MSTFIERLNLSLQNQHLEAAIKAQKELDEKLSRMQYLDNQIHQKTEENVKIKEHIQDNIVLLDESWKRILEKGYTDILGEYRLSKLNDQEIDEVHRIWCDPRIDEKYRHSAIAKALNMSEKQVSAAEDSIPGFRSESQARDVIVEDTKESVKKYQKNEADIKVMSEEKKVVEKEVVILKVEVKHNIEQAAKQTGKPTADIKAKVESGAHKLKTRENELEEKKAGLEKEQTTLSENLPKDRKELEDLDETKVRLGKEIKEINADIGLADEDECEELEKKKAIKQEEIKSLNEKHKKLSDQIDNSETRIQEIEKQLKNPEVPKVPTDIKKQPEGSKNNIHP